jgi:Flp pilus assembly protein TadD
MPVLVCIGLTLACTLTYANSLMVPFVFDDTAAIVENETICSLTNLKQVFSPPGAGSTVQGRPIVNLSFALNYAWSGLDVWSWHVVNMAIHTLAGICLFGISRRALLSPVIPAERQQRATPLAFAIALLWTLHPLQTESVTYVVQRTESLAGLLLLATLYCSIRAAPWPFRTEDDQTGSHCGASVSPACEQERPRQNKIGHLARTSWSIAAVAACALGMASKEVMVAAPLLVVLYDWTFSGEPFSLLVQRRWRLYASLSATWIILAVLVVNAAGRGGSAGFGQGVSSWEYLRTQFGQIVHYLRLSFWPHPLVLDYGNRLAARPGEIIPAGLCVLSLVAGTAAALVCPRFRPAGYLGAWFLCILAPSSSVVPVITQTGAEHRMYLPLAAVIAVVVVTADRMTRAKGKSVGPALLCCAAIVLGGMTVRRNADYVSALSIWRDTVEKCPDNWRAICNLGDEYASLGDLEKAVELFDRSIELKPTEAMTYNNRGDVFLKQGDVDRARRDFDRALEINPRLPAAQANLGIACAVAGDFESALEAFTAAVRLAPSTAQFHWRRGAMLIRLGRHAEAIDELSETLRLDSRFDKAWNDRAHCYQAARQLPTAIADLSRAIEINPNEARYYVNRGIALGMAGRFDESVLDCSAAIQLKPDFLDAYRNRALSYMNLKRYDLARADLAHMQRLGSPPDPRVVKRLEAESPAP